MNQQRIKLLWNRRRTYSWIFIEQALVFAVLVYSMMEVASKANEYFYPGNLDVSNVCGVGIQLPDSLKNDEAAAKERYVMQQVAAMPYVEAMYKGYYSSPFNRPASNNRTDSLTYRGSKHRFYLKTSDENFQRVFKPQLIAGSWFEDKPNADGSYPAVVTIGLAEQLDMSNPIGQQLTYKGHTFTICGVMHDFKTFTFDATQPSAILANSAFVGTRIADRFEEAIRIKEGRMNDFIAAYWQLWDNEYKDVNGVQITYYSLDDSSKIERTLTLLGLLVTVIPALFLLVFAFIGTFSLVYKQSKRRIGEYSLRIAMGESKAGIKRLVLLENLALTCLALLPGLVVWSYLFFKVYSGGSELVWALVAGMVVMVSFSLISSYYPAKLAASIQPAEGLHYE